MSHVYLIWSHIICVIITYILYKSNLLEFEILGWISTEKTEIALFSSEQPPGKLKSLIMIHNPH